jgi:serine/threonine protein kinase
MARCKDIRIATLLDVYPFKDDAAWWVVEEELDGVRLDVQLKEARSDFSMARVVWLATEILLGLRALHAQDVLARELSPNKILVLADRLVLTDFEMAKVFSGASSVAGDWEDTSDYRAPEVSYASDKLCPNCDLFSWARIVVALLTGNPRSSLEKEEDLPKNIKKLLKGCISALPRNRPSSVEEVLERWKSCWGNSSQHKGSACT